MGKEQKITWISERGIVFLKVWLAVYALSEDSLKVLEEAYTLTVPGIKQIFFVLLSFNAWGLKNLVMAVGFFLIFWRMRENQKCFKVTVLSIFFAVCTVLGISYQKIGSWDYLFFSKRQFLLAVLVIIGIYFVYKNCILLGMTVFKSHQEWFYRKSQKKMEIWMFSEHPFAGAFLFLLLCALPWVICFFPGTMQWDGHAQLWMALGVDRLSGHHPVISTQLMGSCIMLGRKLFQSDSIGLAFYTMPQFLIQCLVFAYGSLTLRKWNCPIILSKGALFLWGGHSVVSYLGNYLGKRYRILYFCNIVFYCFYGFVKEKRK